jgi:hypothetical protein
MKKTLIILVLLFSSSVLADDISEFQIEGISIGDSLLDYYNEQEIQDNIVDVYSYKKDKTFIQTGFDVQDGFNLKKYEVVQIELKNNDKNYIIYGITGKLFSNYQSNINACYKKQEEIAKELSSSILRNVEKTGPTTFNHSADSSGRSTIRYIYFFPNPNYTVQVECYSWHKDMPYANNLKIIISTSELNNWLMADD